MPPTCSSCCYFQAPTVTPDLAEAARAQARRLDACSDPAADVLRELLKAVSVEAYGRCCVGPAAIHKKPTEWCGMHPDFPAKKARAK